MSKEEFLLQLRKGLIGLPQEDIDERMTFYSEIIEDKIEEGLSEEEAVLSVGNVSQIAQQIVADTPFSKIAKERVKSERQLKVWEIVLLILGSPIWLSLGIAIVILIFSLYISLWSVIISLWAVFASLIGCSFAGIVAGTIFLSNRNILVGLAILGAVIVCVGLCIFMFYLCKAATLGILMLTKQIAVWIKNCFIRRGKA